MNQHGRGKQNKQKKVDSKQILFCFWAVDFKGCALITFTYLYISKLLLMYI